MQNRDILHMSTPFSIDDLIRDHFISLCAIAMRFVRSSDIAQDIAQDVIIKVWQKNKDINPDTLDSLLFIMVRNESLNYLRSVRKITDSIDDRDRAENTDYMDILIEEETNQILLRAIRKLPKQSARVIELSLLEYTNKEIAELQGISINTVKTLKYIGMRKLREYFLSKDDFR